MNFRIFKMFYEKASKEMNFEQLKVDVSGHMKRRTKVYAHQ